MPRPRGTPPALSHDAWQRALVELETAEHPDAMTTRELMAVWRCSQATASRRVMALIRAGRARVSSKIVVSATGTRHPRPAYVLWEKAERKAHQVKR